LIAAAQVILFTVDLVTRYVAWKLGPGVAVGPN
jgi:hypothetical protein